MSRANPRFHRSNPLLPLPVNNVYRIRCVGFIESQLTINTFYYADELSLATATTATMAAAYNAFVAASGMSTKYAACCSSDWALRQILVDCPTSPSLATQVNLVNVPGTGPSIHEPTTVAAVITKYTGFKGQCGRGRIYTPAIPTSWVLSSSLATSTSHGALGTQMLLSMTNGGHTFTPGIFSRGNRTTKQLGWAPLTNYAVQLTLATCRRRRLGKGK